MGSSRRRSYVDTLNVVGIALPVASATELSLFQPEMDIRGAEDLGRALADRLRGLRLDALCAVWEPGSTVLAHLVAEALGIYWVSFQPATNPPVSGQLQPGARVALLLDAARNESTVDAMARAVRDLNGNVVSLAVLVDTGISAAVPVVALVGRREAIAPPS
jgi:hypothetical protein